MSLANVHMQIESKHLDIFNHVNNAMYLSILEEARWQLITARSYGLDKIKETGLGPVILEVKLVFLKELRLGDDICIETQLLSYEDKVGALRQIIVRGTEICAQADFLFGLFDVHTRRLVAPTPEWLAALDVQKG